jgi:hypothetical protein
MTERVSGEPAERRSYDRGRDQGRDNDPGAIDETTVRIVDALFHHFAKQVERTADMRGVPRPGTSLLGAPGLGDQHLPSVGVGAASPFEYPMEAQQLGEPLPSETFQHLPLRVIDLLRRIDE